MGDFSVTIDAYRIDVEQPHRAFRKPDRPERPRLSAPRRASSARAAAASSSTASTPKRRVWTWLPTIRLPGNSSIGQFDVTFGLNLSNTDVTAVPAIPVLANLAAAGAGPVRPRQHADLREGARLPTRKRCRLTGRSASSAQRCALISYGEVVQPDNNPAFDHAHGPRRCSTSKAAGTSDRAHAVGRRGQHVRRIPRRVPVRPQHDGQHAVLELLALRLLRPLRLRESSDERSSSRIRTQTKRQRAVGNHRRVLRS